MEGFKKSPKIACFKEGGQVGYKSRKTHSETTEDKADIAQDKKIVKKAFSIHDTQQHEEKTDLSKLKRGGRAKKETGTVKKYCGGKTVKKMAGGGLDAVLGTEAQNEASKKNLEKVAKEDSLLGSLERGAQKAANFLKGQGAVTDAEKAAVPAKKRGGKC